MRRPLLLTVIVAVALILVFISQARLQKFVKEGQLSEEAVPPAANEASTASASEQAEPSMQNAEQGPQEASAEKTTESESPKEKVMAALLETRNSFRTRENTAREVKADPHSTPPSIMNAASKLADLLELEQQYPQFKNDFQTFYVECAKDAKVITVTRVQCLEKYFLSRQATDEEKEQILKDMPPIVQRLYRELQQN